MQFEEWAAFYALEPWGFHIDDVRMGILASTILRAAGSKRSKPQDFLLGDRQQEEPDDFAKALAKALKAKPVAPAPKP